jgi:predicted 3-demethylubiquinone-9 3-methyltransferase (glyoxalase superfamily)
MKAISPFLWFDTQAEEAAKFYVSIFKNAKMGRVARYPEGTPGKAGSVMTVSFELDGQEFVALNGGPTYAFTPAVSFVVNCESQAEVDQYWDKLLAGGGKPVQCGWLTDKYGVSWQVVPVQMIDMFANGDTAKTERVAEAMMKMIKLDLPTLQRAYDGK